MLELVQERKPDAVILVDYPGFNLRFAKRVHAMGIKVIYYICPQVWAWHRSRIPQMAQIVDRLITIFPFEQKHFEGTGLRIDFAGHPLVDESRRAWNEPEKALPWKGDPHIALLPGSRSHVIHRILPTLWEAAELVEQTHPAASFIIPAPSAEIEAVVRRTLSSLSGGPTRWEVVAGNTRQVLRQARAALVASGTATIETALMHCPMIVVYKMAPLSYLLGKRLVALDQIGMVNIVAGKPVCPEFIQDAATPSALAHALNPLLRDTPERNQMVTELKNVVAALGPGGASEKAAESVIQELNR
jgi:lipid-A-disaccharide synthase